MTVNLEPIKKRLTMYESTNYVVTMQNVREMVREIEELRKVIENLTPKPVPILCGLCGFAVTATPTGFVHTHPEEDGFMNWVHEPKDIFVDVD